MEITLYYPGDQRRINATLMMMVCVYVCAYSFSVIRVYIIVHVSYNRTHPWLYCLANQRYSWHDVGLGPAVHPHLLSSESCLLRISQRLWRGCVGITVGLHVQLQPLVPFKTIATTCLPTPCLGCAQHCGQHIAIWTRLWHMDSGREPAGQAM